MLLYCATDCTPTIAEYTTLSKKKTMREILSKAWQMEETMYLCNQYQCQM